MSRPKIIRRMDTAIERFRAAGLEPRALYLTDADWEQFNRAASRAWGGPVKAFSHKDVQIFGLKHAPEYRQVPVRRGASSKIYSVHGVSRAIPRRLEVRA